LLALLPAHVVIPFFSNTRILLIYLPYKQGISFIPPLHIDGNTTASRFTVTRCWLR